MHSAGAEGGTASQPEVDRIPEERWGVPSADAGYGCDILLEEESDPEPAEDLERSPDGETGRSGRSQRCGRESDDALSLAVTFALRSSIA